MSKSASNDDLVCHTDTSWGRSWCRRCWCWLHSNAGTFFLQRRRCGPCCPTTAQLRSQFRPHPFRNLTSWSSTTALRPNNYVPSYLGRNSANRKWFTTAGSPVFLTQKVSGCPKTCPVLSPVPHHWEQLHWIQTSRHWTRASAEIQGKPVYMLLHAFACWPHGWLPPTVGLSGLIQMKQLNVVLFVLHCQAVSPGPRWKRLPPSTSPHPLLPYSCYSLTITWKAVSNLLVYIHLRSLAPMVFQTSEHSRLKHERFMILLFPG